MRMGLIGRKCGMTRVFTEDGLSIPVTVIEIEPNRVTQIKTLENDGYSAVQVTTGTRRASRVTQPMAGHFAKAGTGAGRTVLEFRAEATELADVTLGTELTVDRFKAGEQVDVTGITKGRGFSGVVRRHNFRTQDATHGNSVSHRAPGSIGQRQTPGRVFKGKRMAGHYGAVRVTIQSQDVVRVDVERGLLLVKGVVPGATNGNVIVTPAMKAKRQGA